ncbi:hypothetical protein ACIQU6_44400 [Streptomyces sp. NPDC090442]|uniref:hypothetical protein n=1 Tax=Streptomyces sp. NPDC090442 TaxID=3365962 RepID=UPI003816D40C
MSTATLPNPDTVAARAREILDTWQADPEYARLEKGCGMYSNDWTDSYGHVIIPDYDVTQDGPALFPQMMRCMALKSAVYEMTGDEQAAELPVPVPIDVLSHAACAQINVLTRMQQRTGTLFVHATDMEAGRSGGTWEFGDYTHRAYRAAWGPVDERYWIDAAETERRRKILDQKYEPIGISDRGRRATIDLASA